MFLAQAPPPPPPAVDGVVVTAPPSAVLSCHLGLNRSLSACVVMKATPSNCGFGTAALRLAEHMRLDTEAVSRTRGRRVEIPLSFSGIGGCPRPDTP